MKNKQIYLMNPRYNEYKTKICSLKQDDANILFYIDSKFKNKNK